MRLACCSCMQARIPVPFVKLVSEGVLVESFEAGDAVSRYIQAPESINSSIVSAGVEIYLKMLLQEGFVHSDMHPGNLLCAALEGDKPSIALLDCGLAEQLSPEVRVGPAACRDCLHTRCVVVLLAKCTANAYSICVVSKSPHCRLRWECKQCFERDPGSRLLRRFWSRVDKVGVNEPMFAHGVVCWVCMQVKTRFVSFIHALGRGDGEGAARNLLCWTDEQGCPDPDAFVRAMERLAADEMNVRSPEGIDLDRIIKAVLMLCRRHEVYVHSKYASLLLGVCILVGFATGLDPHVNLMDAAIPSLLTYDLTGRLIGRLYS